MKKDVFRKSPEELQEYLQFQRRGSKIKPKKGKALIKEKVNIEI
jgi:hypothetical protein